MHAELIKVKMSQPPALKITSEEVEEAVFYFSRKGELNLFLINLNLARQLIKSKIFVHRTDG